MTSQVIDPGVLINNHCMSQTMQPYLAELLDVMYDGTEDLTIVVGAGASMASGIPSWARLVENLVGQIADEATRDLVNRLEQGNMFRQAETAVQKLRSDNPNHSVPDLVRDALYLDGSTQRPGLLVEAIVRLAVTYPGNVRLVTTNYDDLLEQALNDIHGEPIATSYSLDTLDKWQALDDGDRAVSVLHLHGMVRQAQSPLLPLLLTESDFLAHGRSVQDAVSDLIVSGVSLFVGLSMTDPNLLSPLFDVANSATPGPISHSSFALFTPDTPDLDSPRPAAEYAVVQARYLESRLGLKPILLKTYAQPAQVIAELGLAVREPLAYQDKNPDSTLNYGFRFERAMRDVYSRLRIDADTGWVEPDRSLELSRYLQEALYAPGGPIDIINHARELLRDQVMDEAAEKFSAFLWLRQIPRPAHRHISLGLVASSTYAHWQPWTGGRVVRVWSGSEFNVAQAVFHGSHAVRNQLQPGRLWRGYLALPLILDSMGSDAMTMGMPLDRLTIGAFALDTNGYVDTYERDFSPSELSPLARMTAPQLDVLFTSMTEIAHGFLEDLA